MSAKVSVSDFSEIRWKGHWIWVPEDKVEISMGIGLSDEQGLREESNGLFRKSFTLDAVPARVPARITKNCPPDTTRSTPADLRTRAGPWPRGELYSDQNVYFESAFNVRVHGAM